MAKTYEIWRKTDSALSRYDIANYTKILTVTPLEKIELQTTKYESEVFFRKSLVGNPIFSGQDFYSLLCIKNDTIVNDMVYLFVIKDGVDIYWKGFISITQGSWDEDECTVSFNTKVLDNYTGLIDNGDVKRNLLFEISAVDRKTFYGTVQIFAEWQITEGGSSPTPENNWALVSTINGGTQVVYIEARERCSCKSNNPSIGEFDTFDENGIIVYAREPNNGILFAGNLVQAPHGSPPANHVEVYNGTANGSDSLWAADTIVTDADNLEETLEYSNALLIDDIAEIYISDFGFTFYSEFLDDTPNNPITGDPNKLNNILFLQSSDAARPSATEKARKMELTFNEFITVIRDLDARWYIDSSDRFRIEHINYFDNALSYITAKTYDIDATLKVDQRTDYVSIKRTNKYIYNSAEIYKFEQFKWSIGETRNFNGTKIYYDNEFVNSKIENTTSEHGSIYFTDFPYILAKPTEISTDTIFVVVGQVDGDRYNVESEVGLFDGIQEAYVDYKFDDRTKSYPNNHLSWGNLHERYFQYRRVLLEGYMNDIFRTEFPTALQLPLFQTKRPTILQNEISFQLCPDAFDPNRKIKTFLGEGEVVSAIEEMRTGIINIILEYKDLTEPRTCICLVPQPIQIGTWIIGADCQEIS